VRTERDTRGAATPRAAAPAGNLGRRATRAWLAGALLLAAALLALAPSFTSDYAQQVSFRIFEYAALGQAWNLLAGYGGLVSLGSAAFIGIGEYTTAELTNHGLPLIPAMLVSGAFAVAFASVVSPALFRLRGLYFTIGTLALAEALRLFMVNYNGLGGNIGIFLESTAPTTAQLYWLSLGVAVAATGLVLLVLRTRLSFSLRAVRDDEDAARQMGLVSFRTKLFAFTFAAFLMGVVGGLQAGKLSQIEPYGAFGLQWTVDIVTVVLIGGLATTGGPLIGAVFTVALAELLSGSPELHLAITGAIVIVVVRLAPRGLWGLLSRIWRGRPGGGGPAALGGGRLAPAWLRRGRPPREEAP
jgi:branched-chain amino acid transport system permease protein